MYGYYKGIEVAIHYSAHNAANRLMDWYFLVSETNPKFVSRIISNEAIIGTEKVSNSWLGTHHKKDHPSQRHFDSFYKSFTTVKRLWRKNCSSRSRTMKRTGLIKEELIATVWNPKRLLKMLDAGVDIETL